MILDIATNLPEINGVLDKLNKRQQQLNEQILLLQKLLQTSDFMKKSVINQKLHRAQKELTRNRNSLHAQFNELKTAKILALEYILDNTKTELRAKMRTVVNDINDSITSLKKIIYEIKIILQSISNSSLKGELKTKISTILENSEGNLDKRKSLLREMQLDFNRNLEAGITEVRKTIWQKIDEQLQNQITALGSNFKLAKRNPFAEIFPFQIANTPSDAVRSASNQKSIPQQVWLHKMQQKSFR